MRTDAYGGSVQPDKWARGDDGSKRLVQCPGCWAAAMARKDVDWECECGELMTVVDLRAAHEPLEPEDYLTQEEVGYGL